MQAIQLPQPARIEQRPLVAIDKTRPEPGPGQVRLRVAVCGVCHTDLHTVEGDLDLPRLPLVPGHQVVGVVDKVGAGVTEHRVGDRAGVAWLYDTCGVCRYCRGGQENLCSRARFTGLHADGGYAQYMVANESFAYPLPDAFSDLQAAPLLCAGIIGYRSLRLSGIKRGGRLGLYGFGASAHLAIQVATHWECDVYVFTRSEHHRRLARELGAVWVGGAEDEIDGPLDASVTFAPAGWIVPLALGHLGPGGVLAINAIHMSPIPELDYHLLYGERVVRSVANFTRQDAREFLQLAAEIPIQTEVEAFPLQEANETLLKLKRSEIRGAAALTIPDER
ncbi:MAG: zinc-dependent alcohol dehydrogenase family protein [Chloroflexota bacterium]